MSTKLLISSLRQIKGSLGRYLAIFAIMALGVGFFSGLKVSRSAMVDAGDTYLQRTAMFDYRLLSTLGFEEDDEEAFASLPDVEAAEGGISVDVLMGTQGESSAMRIYSLPERINTLSLVSGRLPEEPDECVLDARAYSGPVGTVLTVSPDNDDSVFDSLEGRSFTITGYVNSPLYLNFTRGTTSVGSGSLSAFLYVPRDAFKNDVYTEMYLRLRDRYGIYTPEYEALLDDAEPDIQSLLDQRGTVRYEHIKQEAQDEWDEAEAEYEEQYADYLSEKESALDELRNAEQEIVDNEDKLNRNEKTLRDSLKRLRDGKEEIRKAGIELDEKQQLLDEQKQAAGQELEAQYQSLTQKEKELSDALAQLPAVKAGLEQLNAAKIELLAAKAYAQTNYESARKDLEQQISALTDELRQTQDPEQADPIRSRIAALEAGAAQAEEEFRVQSETLDAKLAEVEAQIAPLSDILSQMNEDELNAAQTQILSGFMLLEQSRAQAQEEFAAYEAQIEDGRSQLAEKDQELDNLLRQLQSGMRTIEDGRKELQDAKNEWQTAQEDANREFRDAEEEFADARKELDDAQKEIDELSPPDTYLFTREQNAGYVSFENDSSIVESISTVFPLFFFLVAALVCSTTMTRMIQEQRSEIGVLLGLGFSRLSVLLRYVLYAGSAALLGGVTGFFLLSYIIPKVIWMAYDIMYGFADIRFLLRWPLLAASLGAAFVCSAGVTLIAALREMQSMPASLMRPKAPKAGRKILLEKITPFWRHLPFLSKISLRNVFRYKGRMIMMILGIGGCMALLVTGFGIHDSIQNIVDYQFGEVSLHDYELLFSEELNEEKQSLFLSDTGLSPDDVEFYRQCGVDVYFGDSMKSANLCAAYGDNPGKFVHKHDGNRELTPPKGNEALIDRGLADTMKLQEGDELTLMDSEQHEFTVKVAGIFDNYVYHYIYISPELWEETTGDALPNAAHAMAPEGWENYPVSTLMDAEHVANVTVTEELRGQVVQMMSSLDYVVILIIVCAGALAFIVLYNLTHINITERIREIATIKVLGFYTGETASYVFRENMILTVLGTAAGILMGIALHRFVMDQIQIDMVYFETRILPVSYLYSMALTAAFTMLVNFFMLFRLRSVPMAESLKSVE